MMNKKIIVTRKVLVSSLVILLLLVASPDKSYGVEQNIPNPPIHYRNNVTNSLRTKQYEDYRGWHVDIEMFDHLYDGDYYDYYIPDGFKIDPADDTKGRWEKITEEDVLIGWWYIDAQNDIARYVYEEDDYDDPEMLGLYFPRGLKPSQISQTKERIDTFDELTPSEKNRFKQETDQAKTSDDLQKIVDRATKQNEQNKGTREEKELQATKEHALKELDQLTALSDTERKSFEEKIKRSKRSDEVEEHLTQAIEQNEKKLKQTALSWVSTRSEKHKTATIDIDSLTDQAFTFYFKDAGQRQLTFTVQEEGQTIQTLSNEETNDTNQFIAKEFRLADLTYGKHELNVTVFADGEVVDTLTLMLEIVGTLSFQSVPTLLSFGDDLVISSRSQRYPLVQFDQSLTIKDTRQQNNRWSLGLRLVQDFQTKNGDVLADVLYYQTNDKLLPISQNETQIVYATNNSERMTDLSAQWDKNNGPVLVVPGGIARSEAYTGEMSWHLLDVPGKE